LIHFPSKRLLAVLAVFVLLLPSVAGTAYALDQHSHAKAALPVTIFAGWASAEKTDFLAIASYCDTHYNTKVTYQQNSGDYNTELATKVQGGTAPDVATLSTPSIISQYVAGGSLSPLSFVQNSKFTSQYSSFWRKLGTVNGKLYSIFMKSDVKSLVWYSPKKFKAGKYAIPKTWTSLVALTKKMASAGKQPWAFGAGDNWTLTDIFENVYLQSAGVANYNKLVAHTISWTSPSVVNAFKIMNQIVGNAKYIAGGRSRALSQKAAQGATQLVTDPKAEFFQEATFVQALIAGTLPNAKVGTDFSAFAFPAIKKWPTTPVEVGPNGIVIFHDTPGARALIKCLVDPKALAQWAKLGGFISPNSATPASSYPNSILRMAAQLQSKAGKAGLVVGDASDLEPPALGATYEGVALQKWFKTPSSYMSVLQGMENEAKKDYKK
jgi:alpha-glucoside transport system substrate-binding protein